MEVVQKEQGAPKGPTRLGGLLRKECLARLPLNSEPRPGDHWQPEPPGLHPQSRGPACAPGSTPQRWGGPGETFTSALSSMAVSTDEEHRGLSVLA